MERSFLMKKYTLALALFALVPWFAATAYGHDQSQSKYYATRPMVKTHTYKKASTNRKTGGYSNIITNNFYYGNPVQPQYSAPGAAPKKTDYYKKQASVEKKSYTTQERKYFLAHPFFQPLKGKFGSVTDFSYAQNNFNFDLLNANVYGINPLQGPSTGVFTTTVSAKEETSQFAIKEDLSYGLTDSLSLVLMAQYDKTKVTFKDWSIDNTQNDTNSNSDFNLFGIGLQNRFVDNNDWIVMGEAFFQHQKDTANTFIGGLKAGYKINKTTLYGIARVSYTDLIDGDTYGAFVDDSNGNWVMLSYKTDIKSLVQAEGGLGAFSVLNKYFTLNGELMFGNYDWHNQLNLKGAIGWQPADMFALNLYASTVLYDSAKGKTKQYMMYDANPKNPDDYPIDANNPGSHLYTNSTALYTTGDYKIKNYNEWKIGVQGILYF